MTHKPKHTTGTPNKQLRRAARNTELTHLREGRRNRATTYTDRRKQASRNACRGQHHPDT